jgi:hypothetical protein
MRAKLIFIAGAAIGYVLGARAGRPAYERMAAKAADVVDAKLGTGAPATGGSTGATGSTS